MLRRLRRVEISDQPAGDCLLLPGITIDECSDWLEHCLMNINAKIL